MQIEIFALILTIIIMVFLIPIICKLFEVWLDFLNDLREFTYEVIFIDFFKGLIFGFWGKVFKILTNKKENKSKEEIVLPLKCSGCGGNIYYGGIGEKIIYTKIDDKYHYFCNDCVKSSQNVYEELKERIKNEQTKN